MTYIIAEPCIDIKDRSCVDVCPVDCIHEFERILVIDPEECIDCGACEPECPVEAIFPEDALPEKWEPFVKINYAYGERRRDQPADERVRDRAQRPEPARSNRSEPICESSRRIHAEGHEMTNEDLHELTAAYALDALDADERQRVRGAPARAASAAGRSSRELAETVGALAYAAEGPAPPDGAARPHPRRRAGGGAVERRRAAAAADAPLRSRGRCCRRGRRRRSRSDSTRPFRRRLVGQARLKSRSTGGVARADRHRPSTPRRPGKTYEVWVIEGRRRARAGLFHGGGKQVVTLTPAGADGRDRRGHAGAGRRRDGADAAHPRADDRLGLALGVDLRAPG